MKRRQSLGPLASVRLVHGCSTSVPESSPPDRGASGVAHHTPAASRRRGVDSAAPPTNGTRAVPSVAMFDRIRQPSMAAPVAAITTFLVALAVYVRTVLPGVST